MTDHRTPTTWCPYCGTSLDGAMNVDGPNAPDPGDVTVCLYCAGLAVFTDNLGLRFPTDAELERWTVNPDVTRVRSAVLEVIRRRGAGRP